MLLTEQLVDGLVPKDTFKIFRKRKDILSLGMEEDFEESDYGFKSPNQEKIIKLSKF